MQAIDEAIVPGSDVVLAEKTVVEFFAGIGLMRLGLERAGWSVVFANDFDPKKREMYTTHFGEEGNLYLVDDIHLLPVEQVPTSMLATASFPCNDLSLAGSRVGIHAGVQSSAFWGLTRLLEEMGERKPPLLLIENVTGFLTSHGGQDFTDALMALGRLGYGVDALVLDAARFVPQSRQRLFVVGVYEDEETTWSPRPLCPAEVEVDARSKALTAYMVHHPEIRWNVHRLPDLPVRQSRLVDVLDEPGNDHLDWWSVERATYLLSQMSDRHRAVADAMIAGDDWSYGTVFRRVRQGGSMAELRVDGIAGCLRTPRGGSGRQILFKAGKGTYSARLLTPRECARLMGADDFRIDVPLNQALFGFGDAVAAPVIEWIARYYLDPLVHDLMYRGPLRIA